MASCRDRVYNVVVTGTLELRGDAHSVDKHFVIEWSTGYSHVSVLKLDYRLYLSTVVLRFHLLSDIGVLPGRQSVDMHSVVVVD